MKPKTFLLIVLASIFLAALLGYLWHRIPTNKIAQDNSCLQNNEVAFHESIDGVDSVIIRRKDGGDETRRFVLPTSTLLVSEMKQCEFSVITANNFNANYFESGRVENYYLLSEGSLDRWRYSYDEKKEKMFSTWFQTFNATSWLMTSSGFL
ncbi:MAG: hypothetical protein A2939_03850 [Parcubacteria group bacterium RIFCSPLOWO2_01_FULL_48_18]|nr:MAG: hypothetical protein A2939_03850 [Parcubacteria group bacterium RIFCSPLOWO2_01_FULL_48_18]